MGMEQFTSVKARLPWGQLPSLKYKGVTLTQSVSIARFLATEYGLVGRTSLHSAQCDEIVDAVTDIFNARVSAVFEVNDAVKSEKMRKFLQETLPTGLARMERLLEHRGGQFLVGNMLTWADLHLFTLIGLCKIPTLSSSPPTLA